MKRLLNFLVLALVGIVLVVVVLQIHINNSTKDYIMESGSDLPSTYTVIVLGASVKSDGTLSDILRDRVDTAIKIYRAGKVKRFLISGDHGKKHYDEVNAMKNYLLDRGIPPEDIFLDHAGFDTYDSMYRAKHIFQVDSAVVVTQNFHLPRAIYLGREFGLNVYGLSADRREYESNDHLKRREWLANVKAWYELNIGQSSTMDGEVIPITGSSAASHDKKNSPE